MNNPYRIVSKKRKPQPDDCSNSDVSFPAEIGVEVTAHHPKKTYWAKLRTCVAHPRGGPALTRKRTKSRKAKKYKWPTGSK